MTMDLLNFERKESGLPMMKEHVNTAEMLRNKNSTASWGSYPKVFHLGHAAISSLLEGEVLIEEKVDGSQFSFGKFQTQDGAEYLRCRSKGAEINMFAPEAMFKPAVDAVKRLFDDLVPGWTYRAEYLAKPKHNVLAYNRVPSNNLVIFDINKGEEDYLTRTQKVTEAERLGLEVVPWLYFGVVTSPDMFRQLLEVQSFLGGQKIEGIVIKNYARFGEDKKVLMGKFVSEAYKEVHSADWKERNPKQGDILQVLIEQYKTPARWSKAVQHLRDAGQLTDSPKDIGLLFPEVGKDILEECSQEIKDKLFKWAWPHLRRGVTGGLAEWYKEELMKKQFETREQEVFGGTP